MLVVVPLCVFVLLWASQPPLICSSGFGCLQNFGRTPKPRDRRAVCAIRGQLWIYIPVRINAVTMATKTDTGVRDLRFQQLIRTLLADHPVHLDPTSLASFMYAFSNTDKLAYVGESQDGWYFRHMEVESGSLTLFLVRGHVPLYMLQP